MCKAIAADCLLDGAGLMNCILALERPAANVAWRVSGEAASKFWAASFHFISLRAEHCWYAEVDTRRSAKVYVRCRAACLRACYCEVEFERLGELVGLAAATSSGGNVHVHFTETTTVPRYHVTRSADALDRVW
jgi:hypothetical protein